MQYLSLGILGTGLGEDKSDIEKLLEAAKGNIEDIIGVLNDYILCRWSGETVYITVERELKELKEACDKIPTNTREGRDARKACKLRIEKFEIKWNKEKNKFKKEKSKENKKQQKIVSILIERAEKIKNKIEGHIKIISKAIPRRTIVSPIRRRPVRRRRPVARELVRRIRRRPIPRELVRRVVRRHPAVRRLVRRMRYARRFGRPRFSDYGGSMGMMALEDFSMTRPTRKIPEPQWLREFLAPAEEVIYQTAGMQPPYYAPIAPEVPPAYRIPMDMQRYREQTIQGRTQMTAYPPLYYAQAASRNLSVPSPRQFPPIEIESPFTPSGVRMLI